MPVTYSLINEVILSVCLYDFEVLLHNLMMFDIRQVHGDKQKRPETTE
jgi:hypothetical protein